MHVIVRREPCMSELKDILNCYCFMFYWTKNNQATGLIFGDFNSVPACQRVQVKSPPLQVWELNMNEQSVTGNL